MKNHFLAITFLVIMLSSCSEDNDISVDSVSVRLNFTHSWGELVISNEDFNELKFTTEIGDLLSIGRLRYLISELTFTHESGTVTRLDDYNLVDVTNNEGLSFTTSKAILPGNYTNLSFRFGFSEENNIDGAYPDLNTANFNVPGENSTPNLGGGYHYMQFDGSYLDNLSNQSPFNYHVISAIDLTNLNEPVDTSLKINIGPLVVGGSTNIDIQMDVSEWFKNPNTWDLNENDINLMGNYGVQLLMNQNGASVFSLVSISQ
ncbi:MAG: Uncharacterised protein [Flavobacterium sp. SCGC AAA160-P02]|nr:MAG: Uncharacterised protein [Flavobacterium sp. SCGC AAA160-P02]